MILEIQTITIVKEHFNNNNFQKNMEKLMNKKFIAMSVFF